MAYVEASELLSVLKIRSPSDEENALAERCVTAAAVEIDSEIDLDLTDEDNPDDPLSDDELTLAAQVNLDRAIEHWQQAKGQVAFGLLSDAGGILTARNSWERHAEKLAPLKRGWGMA